MTGGHSIKGCRKQSGQSPREAVPAKDKACGSHDLLGLLDVLKSNGLQQDLRRRGENNLSKAFLTVTIFHNQETPEGVALC